MAIAILAAIALYCAFRWLTQYICTTAILWYMEKKNVPFPSERELREGMQWVIQRILCDLFPWINKR